jgi:hypothetical protein
MGAKGLPTFVSLAFTRHPAVKTKTGKIEILPLSAY